MCAYVQILWVLRCAYIHVHSLRPYICARICVYCACIFPLMSVRISMYMCICVFVYVSIWVHMCVYICLYIYVCVYVCMHVGTYLVHVFFHLYVHTQMYICIYISPLYFLFISSLVFFLFFFVFFFSFPFYALLPSSFFLCHGISPTISGKIWHIKIIHYHIKTYCTFVPLQ